jgi:hypothetical protein
MIKAITKDDRKLLRNTDIGDLHEIEFMFSQWLEEIVYSIARQEIEEVKSGYLWDNKRLSVGEKLEKPNGIRIFARGEVPHRFNQYTRYSYINQNCFSVVRAKWQRVLKHGVMDIKEQGGFEVPKNPVILYKFGYKRYTKYPATPNSLFILEALQDWGIIDADQSKEAISVIQSFPTRYKSGSEITVLSLEELVKHPEFLLSTYVREDEY